MHLDDKYSRGGKHGRSEQRKELKREGIAKLDAGLPSGAGPIPREDQFPDNDGYAMSAEEFIREPVRAARVIEVIEVETQDGTKHFTKDGRLLHERADTALFLEGLSYDDAHREGPRNFEILYQRMLADGVRVKKLIADNAQILSEFNAGRIEPEGLGDATEDRVEVWLKEQLLHQGIRDVALKYYMLRRDHAVIWRTYKQKNKDFLARENEWEVICNDAVATERANIEAQTKFALGQMELEVNRIRKSADSTQRMAEEILEAYQRLFLLMGEARTRLLEGLHLSPQKRKLFDRFMWLFETGEPMDHQVLHDLIVRNGGIDKVETDEEADEDQAATLTEAEKKETEAGIDAMRKTYSEGDDEVEKPSE